VVRSLSRSRRRAGSLGPATLVAVIGALAGAPEAAAGGGASPVGLWLTDARKAAVEVFPCGDAVCGRIAWIDESHPPEGARGAPMDRHNPDARLRRQPLCGLEILRGFRLQEDGVWGGGSIYNPEDGRDWRAEMTVDGPDRLRLRGYLLIPMLGETRVWTRLPAGFTDRCRKPEITAAP